MRKTILITVATAAIASAVMPAMADDFKGDNSACWDDSSRHEISCTQLTPEFLMSLRFKTKAEIQKLMNAAGRPISNKERIELHFIGNYTRGSKAGSGVMNVQFDDNGKAVVITAHIDGASTNYGTTSGPTAKFIWSAADLPKGCYDMPSTVAMFCTVSAEEELDIVLGKKEAARVKTEIHQMFKEGKFSR
jgi:hypothetical protein